MDVVFGFVGSPLALRRRSREYRSRSSCKTRTRIRSSRDATKMLALSGPKEIARRSGNIYDDGVDCIDCNINTNWT